MWLAAAHAQLAPPIAAHEQPAARRMIESQLGAFRRDDAPGAWMHVSPALQRQFGSAERFLRVVREAYVPVYRPRDVRFDGVALWDGEPAWWLTVVGPDGRAYRALYLLERQPDGSWRTSGCLLFAPESGPPGAV